MREHFSEQHLLLSRPGEHAAQILSPRVAVAGQRCAFLAPQTQLPFPLDHLVFVRIHRGIHRLDLLFREDVFDDDKPVQIEREELFLLERVAHGAADERFVHHPGSVVRSRRVTTTHKKALFVWNESLRAPKTTTP